LFCFNLHRHVSIDCFSGAGYLIHPRLEIDRDYGGVGGLLATFQPAVDERAFIADSCIP
jgi:hypothetical protein